MQDAFNLAWKLGLVIGHGGNPALLDSYEPERRPIDEAVLRQTDRATRLVSLHGTVTRFVRDHLMSLATRLPVVVEKLGEAISGIAIDYRDSPIVEDHAIGAPGPHAGDRAPDALVDDREPRRLDKALQPVREASPHVAAGRGGRWPHPRIYRNWRSGRSRSGMSPARVARAAI